MKARSTLIVTKKAASFRYDYNVDYIPTPFPVTLLKLIITLRVILGSVEWPTWTADYYRKERSYEQKHYRRIVRNLH